MTTTHYLVTYLSSGRDCYIPYAGHEPASEALSLIAHQLKHHPANREGGLVVTSTVANADGIGTSPEAVIDFREILAARVGADGTA